MKFNKKNTVTRFVQLFTLLLAFTLNGCEKYLNDTQLPATKIAAADVYNSDNTVSTVVTGVFLGMNTSGPFNGGAGTHIAYTSGLFTDELRNLAPGNFGDAFYKNAVQTGQSPFWSALYSKIFVVNTAIEGITSSKGNLAFKEQWLGECYYLRAYFYHLLVNYYGDVPLALTNDYVVNNKLARAPQAEVEQQIIADLKLAQSLLSTDYKNGYGLTTTNRVRPNKAAATALLARMYLYTKDWVAAEAASTALIADANYALLPLAQVFNANSKETILSLATQSARVSSEYAFFNNGMPAVINPPQGPSNFNIYAAMSNQLLSAFEAGDGRLTNWVRTVTVASTVPTLYYFPNKYKSAVVNGEYEMLFRLGEQYLIRAEARAMQNKGTAADDLNAIRTRAGGLNPIAPNGAQATLLTAIAKERQTELFTECGHRFFDLKRTGTIDAVMSVVSPAKGGSWASYMANFPIPTNDLIQDPNLTPNPGYIQ